MSNAHDLTDAELRQLENKIAAEYRKAVKETQAKLDDYLRRFAIKDEKWRVMVANGERSVVEYQQWRTGQIMMGKRWEEMKESLAHDYHNANVIARSIVNGYLPGIYALNHNYSTFEVERGSLIDTSYTLYDRNTVEWLLAENPDLLPPPGKQMNARLAAGKDIAWQEGQIQSVTLQSILQGESIPNMAKRIAFTMGETNHKSSIRYARTAVTGAENKGHLDGYQRAANMGIPMKQTWVATLDNRTRHEHRMLDGQTVDVGKPFKVDGYNIRYPGDPSAPGYLIWNCRCTTIAQIKGFERDVTDLGLRRDEKLGGMSYEEWLKGRSISERITKQEEIASAMKQSYARELYGRKSYYRGSSPNSGNVQPAKAITKSYAMQDITMRTEDFDFSDGAGGVRKTIKANIYELPNGVEFVFPKAYNSRNQTLTVEQLLSAYNGIPAEIRDKGQMQIIVNDVYNPQDKFWRKKYKGFTHSYATGGETINFWRYGYGHDDEYLKFTLCHEMGHMIDFNGTYGGTRISKGNEWAEAMAKDLAHSGKKSMRAYGENSVLEDFADAIGYYSLHKDDFLKDFPNRAAILKLLLGL